MPIIGCCKLKITKYFENKNINIIFYLKFYIFGNI